MKRIYVKENRCLGCRLCGWESVSANSVLDEMFKLRRREPDSCAPAQRGFSGTVRKAKLTQKV